MGQSRMKVGQRFESPNGDLLLLLMGEVMLSCSASSRHWTRKIGGQLQRFWRKAASLASQLESLPQVLPFQMQVSGVIRENEKDEVRNE